MNRSSDADQDVRLAEAKRNFIIELLECKKVLEEAICVMEEVDRDVREVSLSRFEALKTRYRGLCSAEGIFLRCRCPRYDSNPCLG